MNNLLIHVTDNKTIVHQQKQLLLLLPTVISTPLPILCTLAFSAHLLLFNSDYATGLSMSWKHRVSGMKLLTITSAIY